MLPTPVALLFEIQADLTHGRPPQQAALLDFFLLLLCFKFNPQIIVSIEHFQVLRTICILELVFSKIITYYKLGFSSVQSLSRV